MPQICGVSAFTAHTLGSEPNVRNHRTANQGIEGSFFFLLEVGVNTPTTPIVVTHFVQWQPFFTTRTEHLHSSSPASIIIFRTGSFFKQSIQ